MDYTSRIFDCETIKEQVDALRPFSEHTLQQLKKYYRVNLTYTSNAIEGSTLTETETKVVLEDGITIGGKPVKDHLAAIGHAKAYDFLYELLDNPVIQESDILKLHQYVAAEDEGSLPGQYRDKAVIITGTEFIPPKAVDISKLMNQFLNKKLPIWQEKLHPIDVAALAHFELVHIHPFMDGNGRTASLLMNLLLLKSGYAITIIPPVLRSDYIAALDIAHLKENTQPFQNFISHVAYESLKNLLRLATALSS